MSANTVELTDTTFQPTVEKDGIVFVDFWAPWCGPCRSFAPVYEKVAEANSDVMFAKVNTDEQQMLAKEFEIKSIPTLAVFRDRVLLFMQPGALPQSALEQLVTEVKKLDMAEVNKKIDEIRALEEQKKMAQA